MASALYSGASGAGSRPGQGHCVVFLGKTINSHSASFHPGALIEASEFNAKEVTLRWTSIPSRGEQKYTQSRHATETGINSDMMSDLAHADFTFTY